MSVCLLGIPFDGNSSYLKGAAQAPSDIRRALNSASSNTWTEDGVDLGAAELLKDQGDLALSEATETAFASIESKVCELLERGDPLICLGGDHSITYPIVKGYRQRFPDLTILHLDAHPDLYSEFEGNPFSHACPFARIMEEQCARRLVQVGIRTLNGWQWEQAQRFGVEIITMRNLERLRGLQFEGPLYVSCDLDVFDPAFAPGVSHLEPGGMTVRDALALIQSLRVPVIGADIVEYNPARDRDGQTAMVAAKVLKEIAAAMLRRGAAPKAGWP